ncbi:MAG: DUF2625 domain-containing protein [Bacteroidota bacterium]
MKRFFAVVMAAISSYCQAQNILPVERLIKSDSTWSDILKRAKTARNRIEILEVDKAAAARVLHDLQVTNRSHLGAIVYNTGGILVDDGWIRIMGSGNAKLHRTVSDWNIGKAYSKIGEVPRCLHVADDAAGGYFLINYGKFGKDTFKMYYFSPDNLQFEPLDIYYNDFLNMCFTGDLEDFYSSMRWNGWRKEVRDLKGDMVYTFYPFLFTKEGKDINKNSRKAIPVEEQYGLSMDILKQIAEQK